LHLHFACDERAARARLNFLEVWRWSGSGESLVDLQSLAVFSRICLSRQGELSDHRQDLRVQRGVRVRSCLGSRVRVRWNVESSWSSPSSHILDFQQTKNPPAEKIG
jgi:hypothetical protein